LGDDRIRLIAGRDIAVDHDVMMPVGDTGSRSGWRPGRGARNTKTIQVVEEPIQEQLTLTESNVGCR